MISASDIEDAICGILQRVSNECAARIDREMSFDRFGLDSLARVGLLTELSKQLRLKFDTTEALDCESPRELAEFLVSQQKSRVRS
ncbi:acyl carrier protein [Schlesneria paludicola]|uniref:acyl carrier protein n=1 Tax=Schlesneria paludicola TaxID=360056 RepID=UPI00029A2D26|nr:acyl carrier protein [Schlesneria paludicola]